MKYEFKNDETVFYPESERDLHALAVIKQQSIASYPYYQKNKWVPTLDYCIKLVKWLANPDKFTMPERCTDSEMRAEFDRVRNEFVC